MSATDPQVLANEAKVPGGQGSLGELNISNISQSHPNPISLELTQLPSEMEGFYVIVGLLSSKFGTMITTGFISPGDLAYFDESIINQLSIKLSSKAQLKNYIKWRDQYLGFTSKELEYITITSEELANVW